jgi:hypothetical protein
MTGGMGQGGERNLRWGGQPAARTPAPRLLPIKTEYLFTQLVCRRAGSFLTFSGNRKGHNADSLSRQGPWNNGPFIAYYFKSFIKF